MRLIAQITVFSFYLAISAAESAMPYQPQHPDPAVERWRWKSFPELNGQGLQCMAAGQDDAIWFGVEAGVVRYDGKMWRTYTEEDGLLTVPVQALFATRDGVLYAGATSGVSMLRPGQTRWEPLFSEAEPFPWNVTDIYECSDEALWIATAWGILRIAPGDTTLMTSRDMGDAFKYVAPHFPVKITRIPEPAIPERPWNNGIGIRIVEGFHPLSAIVWLIAPDSPGARAGLQIGDRIIRVDGHPLVIQNRLDGRPNSTVALTVVRSGDPNPFELEIERQQIAGTYRDCPVFDVFQARDGTFWFGISGRIHGGEILRYQLDNTWRLYTASDGLIIGYRPRIIQAHDGTIWTASYDKAGGVNAFDGKQWRGFKLTQTPIDRDLLPLTEAHWKDTNSALFAASDGTIWIGSYGALYTFKNDRWTAYQSPEISLPAYILDICETSDGGIWFAGRGQQAIRLESGHHHWISYKHLSFWCEAPENVYWFLSQDRKAVRSDGASWMQFDQQDGLIDRPERLVATHQNEIWAIGSHRDTAATARLDGLVWIMYKHPELGPGINPRSVYLSPENHLWIGGVETGPMGMLRFDRSSWTYYLPFSEVPQYVYGIEQTADGTLWFGGSSLHRFDGKTWAPVLELPELLRPGLNWIDALTGDGKGGIWVGTRSYGMFHYDGQNWSRHNTQHGLADNAIKALLQAGDGTLWAVTDFGVSRFDGQSWITHALPATLTPVLQEGIHQARDGALWINRYAETIRYMPDDMTPETEIAFALKKIPHPGNVFVSWKGQDPWNTEDDLWYSYRLNDAPWTAFSRETQAAFSNLVSGHHFFEVRARDRDFNVDPTPASITFTVLPPVWRQGWFVSMMAVLMGAIGYLSTRLIKRDRQLATSNRALSEANRQLFSVNQNLTHEIAERERMDAQIQNLQFLYNLRMALGDARTPSDVAATAGCALLDVLGQAGHVAIALDAETHTFGEAIARAHAYDRPLVWGQRERGQLMLHSAVSLSESQERTLLDETVAQLSRTLEARELQMQLLQSARLVSLGQLAAGVAHELNQPLGGISATAEDYYLRLEEGIGATEDQIKASFKRILDMVARMSHTVEHLRVFSRDTTREPGYPVQVNGIIHSSLDIIGTQLKNHGILVELDLSDSLPEVVGQPFQLEQVFLNLLGNARDALDARGSDLTLGKRIEVRTRVRNAWVVVEVADNGAGILPEHQKRIFEPFFTTKSAEKGTGLGLSITYAIVKNHGGDITCTSAPGQGATFRVSFPVRTL